jgi:hypothetical protein
MLKSYEELRKIDVTRFCEERKAKDDNGREIKVLYLNWAKCIDLLHENGAEVVYFIPLVNKDGSSLFMTEAVFTDNKDNSNRCYETRIEIHIDDKTYLMHSPVMNGTNPVKDNSMSLQRVWNSICRSFVKGVAIYTGLGFDLWLKEEDVNTKSVKDDIHHDIMQVRERVFEKITTLNKHDMSISDIAAALNRSEEEVKNYLAQYKVLYAFENNLDVLIKKL